MPTFTPTRFILGWLVFQGWERQQRKLHAHGFGPGVIYSRALGSDLLYEPLLGLQRLHYVTHTLTYYTCCTSTRSLRLSLADIKHFHIADTHRDTTALPAQGLSCNVGCNLINEEFQIYSKACRQSESAGASSTQRAESDCSRWSYQCKPE